MGKFAKVFLFLLSLNSASSYSATLQPIGEMKSVRSLGFDGKDVKRPDNGQLACGVLSLHPDSLASRLGIQEGDTILWYWGNLLMGCEDIDNHSRDWKDRGRREEIQVMSSQGLRDLPITTEQFLLAKENLSKPPSLQNSTASSQNSVPWYSRNTRSGDIKMIPNTNAECEGIRITRAGLDYYNNIAPYMYVSLTNQSGKRKKITLDIHWRKQSETYQGKNEHSWAAEFGPETLRSGEETKFFVKKDDLQGVTMQEVELAECR